MDEFIFFTSEKIKPYLKSHNDGILLGDRLKTAQSFEALTDSEVHYVLLGVPEDIGGRANFGKTGTEQAWNAFLSAFLNVQVNQHISPERCLLLGEVNCELWMEEVAKIDANTPDGGQRIGKWVKKIDGVVSKIVSRIVSAGKVPVVVGGGQNNAYGIINGCAEALEDPISVLNIDARADLQKTNYRHNRNSFSFAKKEGFLKNYTTLGVHKNHTPEYIFEVLAKDKSLAITFVEDLLHMTTLDKLIKFKASADFVHNVFGLEVDFGSLAHFGGFSARSTGFGFEEIRSMVKLSCKQQVLYLHLCEASPLQYPFIGEALSYLVSDFIREME